MRNNEHRQPREQRRHHRAVPAMGDVQQSPPQHLRMRCARDDDRVISEPRFVRFNGFSECYEHTNSQRCRSVDPPLQDARVVLDAGRQSRQSRRTQVSAVKYRASGMQSLV